MSAPGPDLTVTAYALLGQLALRPWSVYEMTRNVGRTLHWFWPRAESGLYAEVRRLAEAGCATVSEEPGRRGRPRSVYAITDSGRAALRSWLASTPAGTTLHSEPLLRVHLAPYGTSADLLRALGAARDEAEALLRQALVIGTEFAAGRHQFQEQVHVRAILFDGLWSLALSRYLWAERSLRTVEGWSDIGGDPAARARAVERIVELMAAGSAVHGSGSSAVKSTLSPAEHRSVSVPMAEREVRLVPIDEHNVRAVFDLRVAPGQEEFVASNAWSLAQAVAEADLAWPRAIVARGEVVGFLMLEIDLHEEEGRHFFLWRLMIGEAHQRRGFGSAALGLAVEEVRARGGTAIWTSWVDAPGGPGPFYLAKGFAPTGELDDGEVVAVLAL